MKKPVIVYPDADEESLKAFSGDLLNRLENVGSFKIFRGTPKDDEEFKNRVIDAEVIILGWKISQKVIESAKNLKLIVFTGIGASNFIDLNLARKKGILVCNTPGYANQTVAEHTFALMLSSTRKINELDQSMKRGDWNSETSGFDLNGKTLGLVGLGGIGSRVAELANAFGMRLLCCTANPKPDRAKRFKLEFCCLEKLFLASDIVSLHQELNESTTGMIGEKLLSNLRDGGILINTARAELIDESSLLNQLKSGRIMGAFDVFHTEPLPEKDILRKLSNVVITPHTGYNTPDANNSICELATIAVEQYFLGSPVNVV